MTSKHENPKPGDTVVLIEIPLGLVDGLPTEAQEAIAEAVGKPILLTEYDEDGRAELEFTDRNGVIHSIFVKPDFIVWNAKADG
jgi:hypothetical protein